MKESFDIMLLTVIVRTIEHVVAARQRARQIAALLGFDSQSQTRLATAVSEIARNAHSYASIGKVEYWLKQNNKEAYLQVKISDKGPGIKSLKAILENEDAQKVGIRSAQRMVDYFDIQSKPGQGTLVFLRLNFPPSISPITTQKIGQLSDELARHRPASISDEITQQNQELLQALNLVVKARDELETRIQQRTVQLVTTNQALEKLNDRLHLALQSAHMGTWQWDAKNNQLELDSYIQKLFKLEKTIYSLKIGEKLPFLTQDENDLIQNQIVGRNHDLKDYDIEFNIVWPDSEQRTMASRGHIYRDKLGKPLRMIGICWDITEKNMMERIHRQYQKKLAQVERVNSMGELASSLAHELNQPLATVVNFIKGSLRRLKIEHYENEEVLQAMHSAAEQAELAGEILHRMKAFVTKGQLHYENININLLIEECIKMIQHDQINNMPTIRVELAKCLPMLKIDKIQLQQVLLNLLRNALQALQMAKTQHPTILIRTIKLSNKQLEVAVIDNGPGIDSDNIEKIWEPHYTTKESGMGIGLAICRTIIEAHQGQLIVENNHSEGACFKLFLPL